MKRLVLMMIPALMRAMRKNSFEYAKYFAILLISAVFAVGCGRTIQASDENGEEPQTVSTCGKDVIVDATQFENAPNDQVAIVDLKIEGNCLKIKFTSSGCDGSKWKVELIGWGNYDKSLPPQTTMRLSLDNQEDCLAVITKEVSFNLEPLMEYFQHHSTNSIVLNISGKSILYEF